MCDDFVKGNRSAIDFNWVEILTIDKQALETILNYHRNLFNRRNFLNFTHSFDNEKNSHKISMRKLRPNFPFVHLSSQTNL